MNTMKRFSAALLAIAMIVAMMPMAFAAGNDYKTYLAVAGADNRVSVEWMIETLNGAVIKTTNSILFKFDNTKYDMVTTTGESITMETMSNNLLDNENYWDEDEEQQVIILKDSKTWNMTGVYAEPKGNWTYVLLNLATTKSTEKQYLDSAVITMYLQLKNGTVEDGLYKDALAIATPAEAAACAQSGVAIFIGANEEKFIYGTTDDTDTLLNAPYISYANNITFAKEAITGTVAITGSTIVGGTLSLDTTVPAGYTVSWQYADTNAVIGTAATYTTDEDDIGKSIKAVLSHADYSGSKESAPVTITDKTAPTANAPAGVTATYGQKLSEIALTNPDGNTAGTWAWKTPNAEVGNVGNNQFVAVFTPDDTANYAIVEKNVTVTVAKKTVTVDLGAIAEQIYNEGAAIEPALTGIPAELKKGTDYTVKFENNVNAGTATVTVTPIDSSNYSFAEDSVNFTIKAKTITPVVAVVAGENCVYKGEGVAVTPESYTVTWNGKALPTSEYEFGYSNHKVAGTAYVVITDAAGGNYTFASVDQPYTIKAAPYTYTGPAATGTVTVGDSYPASSAVTAKGVNSEDVDGTLKWFKDAACTQAATGTFETVGTETLYWQFVRDEAETNYTEITKPTGSVVYTVDALPKHTFKAGFDKATAEKTFGDANFTKAAELDGTTADITYSSSNTAVAIVNETTGEVTIKGAGTATITATAAKTATHAQTAVSYTLNVAKANQAELTVKTDKAAIKYDETATLSVVGGTTAGEVTYTLVEGPATIANGVVTPTGVGTIKVKAVMAGNDNYNAVESANVVEIVVSKADQAAPAKPTGSYKVSTTDATKFVYTVTAVAGAEYSKDGTNWQDSNVFDGIAPGATVTFSVRMKADDNHNASPATAGDAVEFVKLANTNVPALKYTVTGTVGSRTITITPVDGAEYKFGTGEWGATNTFDDNSTSGATVAIAIRYKETATLKASEAATASVNTAKTAQTVTAPAVTFEYGNTGKIVPTASSKNFTYEVTAGADVISVDANGVVTALKAGSAQVTVTALEDETYAQATVVVNVTVNKVKVTVKADDVQLKINGELPASYTYTVTGLKGTDALTATVAVKDGATPDVTKAGEYVLVASGAAFTAGSADNYEITYVDGTLSIKNNIVVIPVAPKPDEDEPVEPEKPVVPVIGGVFTDVKADDWFAGAVEYVYENGLMDGMGNNQFAPYGTTTRGQIVTILWRLEGKPLPSITNPFSDVGYSEWYSTAITWAAEHKIVNGVTTTTFDPTAPITREQIAAILYRYAQYKGYDMTAAADLGTYADAASVSGYAVNAMKWACGTGLINGIDGALAPSGTAIRCQAATLLMRFCENVAK